MLSGSTQNSRIRPKNRYRSGFHRTRTDISSIWWILSAKYGFLLPSDVVPEDYNVTFNNKTTNPITIDRLQKQVVEKKLDGFKKIVIIAGENYAKIAKEVFSNAEVITPLKGLGGNIMQANILAKAVKNNTLLERDALGTLPMKR